MILQKGYNKSMNEAASPEKKSLAHFHYLPISYETTIICIINIIITSNILGGWPFSSTDFQGAIQKRLKRLPDIVIIEEELLLEYCTHLSSTEISRKLRILTKSIKLNYCIKILQKFVQS